MPFVTVTDKDLLKALEGGGEIPVTDPTILNQLNDPEENLGERMLIGAGRGFTDVGEGIKQLGLQAGEKVGLVDPATVADFNQRATQERQLFEQSPVGRTIGSKVGRFGGNVLPAFAIPGAAGGLLARVAGEAAIGGGIGATQFVPEGQSRLSNIATGAATGGGVAGGLGLLGNVFQRSRLHGQNFDEAVSLGQQAKVPILAGDVGSPNVSRLSVLLEDLPGSGIKAARLKQSALAQKSAQGIARRQAAEAAATEFGGKTGIPSITKIANSGGPRAKAAQSLLDEIDSAGDDLGLNLKTSQGVQLFRKKLIADKFYDRVGELAGTRSVKTPQTASSLDDAIKELERSVIPDDATLNLLKTVKGNLKDLSYVELREADSALGAEISNFFKGQNALVGKRGVGHLQNVKDALRRDMDVFAETGGAALKRANIKANAFYRNNIVPASNNLIARSFKEGTDPDEIFIRFINQAVDRRGRGTNLYNALDDRGRAMVRAGVARQALDKSINADGLFSPAKYANEIDRLQNRVNTFFKGPDEQELEGFSQLMKHIKRAGQVAENPPTGQRAAQLLTGAGQAGLAVSSPSGAAGVISGTVGARILFSTEAGRKILLGAARSEPGSVMMEGFISQANKLITRAGVVGAIHE